MKLYSVKITGYKRFGDASINLESKVIAVVGPNEAGKSSLLAAMALLSNDDPVPQTALTRGYKRDGDDVVQARYRLTDDERKRAPWALPDSEARWLFVAKTVAGPRRYYFDPPMRRSRNALDAALVALTEALRSPWFTEWQARNRQAAPPLHALPDRLKRGGEALDQAVLAALLQAVRQMETIAKDSSNKAAQDGAAALAPVLRKAHSIESLQSPDAFAESFKDALPEFLLFTDADRTLQSEFNLDKPPVPRIAWDNLARMANLDLKSLKAQIKAGDSGSIQTQVQRGRRALQKALAQGWKQSHLGVSFDREGPVLKITVTSDDPERNTDPVYFALHDRSDGVRTFIALRAFLAARRVAVPPILLVDEAEAHLHYDAQADLMRLFEDQREAAQVVYTTHSVGCLPSDLGRGVRVVVPDSSRSRSTIVDSWSKDAAGVTPLMVAMGAGTLQLTPSRYVVITEGSSEALLLPTLIREANGVRTLPYQIVSGLARSSVPELQRLTHEAPLVAFLADGDKGGDKHAARLATAGIGDDKVVRLSSGLCLEDLIDPALYTLAINDYLASWPPHAGGFTMNELPAAGRPNAVRAWCRRRKIADPSKQRVAETILRLLGQEKPPTDVAWVDDSRVDEVKRLHAALLRSLDLG
jgi:predicted ATPase